MSQAGTRENRPDRAIGIVLFSFLLFTGLDTVARYLALAGLHPAQIALMRSGVHLAIVVAIFLPREGWDIIRTRRPGIQLIRGIALMLTTVLNFYAVRELPIATTIAIIFAMPLIVCLLAWPILGERVGPRRLIAVATGFGGVLIITDPWGGGFHPAMFYSLAAAAAAALYFTLTRLVAGEDTAITSQFFVGLVATAGMLPLGLGAWVPPESTLQWGLLVLAGVLGFVGHLLITVANRFAEASVIAPMIYSQMVYAIVLGWIVFGDLPNQTTFLGSAIVIASGLYIWLRERRLAEAGAKTPAAAP